MYVHGMRRRKKGGGGVVSLPAHGSKSCFCHFLEFCQSNLAGVFGFEMRGIRREVGWVFQPLRDNFDIEEQQGKKGVVQDQRLLLATGSIIMK